MKNKPNFFIVGAPKCGTTSLSEYLRTHPNVFMTRPKEPHFFAEDFFRPIETIDEYLALFVDVKDQHYAVGEASVTYMASHVAAENIKNFSPNAQLIVMVRNPLQMIPSLHAQLLVSLDESEKDFSKAWFLQDDRKHGKNIPPTNRSPLYLQYTEIGSLGSQLNKLFQIFERNQIEIIVFDDFVAQTKKVYQDTLAFLNVPIDERESFPKINANKTIRFRGLSLIVRRPPRQFLHVYRQIKRMLNLPSMKIRPKLNQLNSLEVKRKEISREMKNHLIETFTDEVLLLSELIKRDLTYWLKI